MKPPSDRPSRHPAPGRPSRPARPQAKRAAEPRAAAPRPSRADGAPKRPAGGRPGRARPLAADVKAPRWVPGPGARTIRAEAGQDLAHFVAAASPGLSIRKARELLEKGCCRINGRIETFGSYELVRGDVVELILPEADFEHRFDPKRIIHDDLHLLAYDKPAFLAVTPQDGPKSWSLYDILSRNVGQLFPVHRIDADTSGLVLFARDQATAQRLEVMFREHGIEKTYHAVVRGHPREEGMHRSYLVKVEERKGVERWKSGRGAEAREAVTAWQVEERLGTYGSLVKVLPKTGRHHQIRLHFSELGYPLYGDRIYGDRLDPVHVNRQMLHASGIHLPNPGSGPALNLRAPLPKDMTDLMERIRKVGAPR